MKICKQCNIFKIKVKNKWICSNCQSRVSNLKYLFIKKKWKSSNKYELTKEQKKAAIQLLILNQKGYKQILLYAICGSGKTDIILNSIIWYLNNDKCIAFICPRSTILVEHHSNFEKLFNQKFSLFYAKHKSKVITNLNFLTPQQAKKFKNQFDVLFFDEIDAFPYNKNKLLNNYIKQSLKKNATLNMITATPSKNDLKLKSVKLFVRYHNEKLVLPIIVEKTIQNLLKYVANNNKNQRNLLIFCHSKLEMIKIYKKLIFNGYECIYVSSYDDVNKKMELLNEEIIKVFVCTTILERGVTFQYLDVIIWNASHLIFNEKTLIQIYGRVGRKISDPKGNIYLFSNKNTKYIKDSINLTKKFNEMS